MIGDFFVFKFNQRSVDGFMRVMRFQSETFVLKLLWYSVDEISKHLTRK